MDEEIYIEKKIKCPSCKNGIEFALKLKNVELNSIKMNTKCTHCGCEIILTPSNIVGIINENVDKKYVEENKIKNDENETEDYEIPSDINSFFDEVEEKINLEFEEVEENRKKREYINDIFS